MKTVIYQDKNLVEYNKFCNIIQKAEAAIGKITEILFCGENKGSDLLCKQYSRDNNLKITSYSANWNDIKCSGANIKERVDPWSKKKKKYNANAGFQRNERMINDASALIILDITIPGATNIVKLAQDSELKIFISYKEEDELSQEKIEF